MASNSVLPLAVASAPGFFRRILEDSLTVWWGDWLDLRVRIWQIIASGLVSPLIYILAFGLGLGSTLDKVIDPVLGDNYLEFILPGMVALSSMTISFGGTTFSICGERLYSRTFEEVLLLPVHPLALHLGKMLAGVTRGLMTSASVIAVSIFATGKVMNFINPMFLSLLLLNCMVFSALGVLVGLKVESLESVGLYNNFVIVPMSFLGATFFDPSQLPGFLKLIVYLLPLTYASVGLRAAAFLPARPFWRWVQVFPWYTLLVLAVLAAALSMAGAHRFAHQQD